MSPVMQGSNNETSEKPFCPCRWIWQNCSCHGLLSAIGRAMWISCFHLR